MQLKRFTVIITRENGGILVTPLPPMDAPAVLHRRIEEIDPATHRMRDVIVAEGPLVIMAYGLLSMEPAERVRLWISSPAGNLDSAETEEAIERWRAPPPGYREGDRDCA